MRKQHRSFPHPSGPVCLFPSFFQGSPLFPRPRHLSSPTTFAFSSTTPYLLFVFPVSCALA